MPALSTRNSTFPAFTSLIALATSKVTVPVLGLGIRPRGPSTLPSFPAERIMSGVAITASKSVRSEEHTSELQSRLHLVCRLLLEKKKTPHDKRERRHC